MISLFFLFRARGFHELIMLLCSVAPVESSRVSLTHTPGAQYVSSVAAISFFAVFDGLQFTDEGRVVFQRAFPQWIPPQREGKKKRGKAQGGVPRTCDVLARIWLKDCSRGVVGRRPPRIVRTMAARRSAIVAI